MDNTRKQNETTHPLRRLWRAPSLSHRIPRVLDRGPGEQGELGEQREGEALTSMLRVEKGRGNDDGGALRPERITRSISLADMSALPYPVMPVQY